MKIHNILGGNIRINGISILFYDFYNAKDFAYNPNNKTLFIAGHKIQNYGSDRIAEDLCLLARKVWLIAHDSNKQDGSELIELLASSPYNKLVE